MNLDQLNAEKSSVFIRFCDCIADRYGYRTANAMGLKINEYMDVSVDTVGRFHGRKLMDWLKDKNKDVYRYTLGYFGSHDFITDLNH